MPNPENPTVPSPARPARRFGLRRGLGLLMVVAILGLLAVNYFLSRHRTLHVVNGFAQPILIKVEQGVTARVPPFSEVAIEVVEGENNVSVSGPTNLSFAFQMPGTLRERWLGRQRYLLNPGAAAVLMAETADSAFPTNATPRPTPSRLYYGEVFRPLPPAEYVFRDFPPNLKLKPRTTLNKIWRVTIWPNSVPDLFFALASDGASDPALKLAQWYLRSHPDDIELLPVYVGMAMATRRGEEARAFLSEGVKRRPVNIQWHRMYQEVEQGMGVGAQLITRYEELLRSDPTNSALLYLRGRLAGHQSEAIAFYERALAQDARNAYASYALGFSLASVGDWTNARPHLARARQLQPNDAQMEEIFFDARLALGEWASLESELTARRAVDPLQYMATVQLADVLCVQGKVEQLGPILATFATALAARRADNAPQIMSRLRSRIAYSLGDFQSLVEIGRQDPTPDGLLSRFNAAVELQKPAEAAALLSPDHLVWNDPLHLLAVAMALDQAGVADQATVWREQALKLMRSGREEYRLTSEMIGSGKPPALAAVLDLSLAPQGKAVLLIMFAQQFPETASHFKAVARFLNVHREFPYHLINRLAR